jgi:proteasome lid subunit RPN8/RPN11
MSRLEVLPLLPAAERELVRALRASPGREVVGFLLTDSRKAGLNFWRLRNYGEQHGAFALDPLEVRRVRRTAARRGMRIAAFVHSHPSSLDRSRADRTSQALTALPWMIVRLDGDRLRQRLYPALP